ncbi:DUF1307 domain-containing protein [Lactococcus lactis]|nr:DUF1307 domain-containing protein [Lactococcus lactis]
MELLYNIMNILRRYRIIIVPAFYLLIMIVLTVVVSGVFTPHKITLQKFDVPEGENRVVITYYYRGDEILRQKTKLYNNYDETKTPVNEFKKNYKGLTSKYKSIKGVSVSNDFSLTGIIVETIDVNYNDISQTNLKKYHGQIEKGELPQSKPVSLKSTKKTLIKYGFVDSATSFKLKEKKDN